jgi:hypothetical protein
MEVSVATQWLVKNFSSERNMHTTVKLRGRWCLISQCPSYVEKASETRRCGIKRVMRQSPTGLGTKNDRWWAGDW